MRARGQSSRRPDRRGPPGLWWLLPLLILLGCRPAPAPRPVSLLIFGDAAERQAYLDLVAAFQQHHPEIPVALTHVPAPSDYRTRLAAEFAAGAPPDITLLNYRRYAAFAAHDLLVPVHDYLARSDSLRPADFYPAAMTAFTWEGQLMCLPQNLSSLVVYYNQDLFDAAGLPYPADDWDWEALVAAARALTVDQDGDGRPEQYGLGVTPSLYRLAPFVWQHGGRLVDNPVAPARLTLTRPDSLAALQWFVDLRQVHGVVPGRVDETALDSESRFVAGTTAMWLNSRRGTPAYRQIQRFRWDVAPLPRGRLAAGVLHSDGYCLSRAAPDPQAAWTFIEFAGSETGQTLLARSGRIVPSRIEVAESPAFLDPTAPPARGQVWLDTVAALRPVPVVSTWEEIERAASAEIERAFYGEIDAATAADLAFRRTEEYFFLGQTAGGR